MIAKNLREGEIRGIEKGSTSGPFENDGRLVRLKDREGDGAVKARRIGIVVGRGKVLIWREDLRKTCTALGRR